MPFDSPAEFELWFSLVFPKSQTQLSILGYLDDSKYSAVHPATITSGTIST